MLSEDDAQRMVLKLVDADLDTLVRLLTDVKKMDDEDKDLLFSSVLAHSRVAAGIIRSDQDGGLPLGAFRPLR